MMFHTGDSLLIKDWWDTPIGWKATLLFIASISLVIWLGMYTGLGLYVAILIAAVPLGVILMRQPILWFVAIILGYILIFWQWTAEFTPIEFAHAVLMYGGILWWFFQRVVILRKPIHWSFGGVMYLLLTIQIIVMIPISLAFGAEPFPLAREVFVMMGVLLFVPLAHEVKTVRQGKIILAAILFMPVVFAIRNVMLYKERILVAYQFWQVEASRTTESYYLLLFLAIAAVTMLVVSRTTFRRYLWLMLVTIAMGACILSFYRAIWIAVPVCILLMGMLLGKAFWKYFFTYTLLVTSLGFLGFQIFFSEAISLSAIETAVVERFISMKKGVHDPSLRNRIIEAEATLQQSGINLIIGHGLSTEMHFMNFITFKINRSRWNHNAFPWMIFHFGIVGSLFLLSSFLAYMWKGWTLQRRLLRMNTFDESTRYRLRVFVIGALAVLFGTLLQFWTGNPYLDRSTFLVLSVLYAFFEILDRELSPRAVSIIVNRSV